MTWDFKGKNVVAVGRFKLLSKDDFKLALRDMGAICRNTIRSTTHFVIASGNHAKLDKTRRFPLCVILTEEAFVAHFEAHKASREVAREDTRADEALAEFRALLYDAPSRQVWCQIMALLDACGSELLELAVDYVEERLDAWPDLGVGLFAPLPVFASMFDASPNRFELRTVKAGDAWRDAIAQGEVSPKFRLARALNLSYGTLQGTAITRLIQNPSLQGLRALHFSRGSMPAIASFKALAESLPALHTLSLHRLTPRHAQALCAPGALGALRYLNVGQPKETDEAARTAYDKLFEADWWPHVEGLSVRMGVGYAPNVRSSSFVLAMAARADRLKNLKHLILNDNNDLAPLFEAGLFDHVERLSLGDCPAESITHTLDLLDDLPDHAVHTLDLSRIPSLGYRYASINGPLLSAAVGRLLTLNRPERLQRVLIPLKWLPPDLLDPLTALSHEASLELIDEDWFPLLRPDNIH